MKELDPLLHSQLRLAVMSILMNVDEADFVYLKKKTDFQLPDISLSRKALQERKPAQFATLPTRVEKHLKNMSTPSKNISTSKQRQQISTQIQH